MVAYQVTGEGNPVDLVHAPGTVSQLSTSGTSRPPGELIKLPLHVQPVMRIRYPLGVLLLLVACHTADRTPLATRASPSAEADGVRVTGTFVKRTNFPCHLSDPFVGGMPVTFRGMVSGRTIEIVTGSANWVGERADPPVASIGQCRQVAPFEVELPLDTAYVVEINHHRFAPVTLDELRAEGMRHTFHLPS